MELRSENNVGEQLRPRQPFRRVHYAPVAPVKPSRLLKQRLRIQRFQRRWLGIKQDLPPQLSRSHIGMISIGGVIGTGLFLGSADALYHGGPLGALLGYMIIGTVVYCLCVSIGEMIAFLPNVGGVVGLADLYVDPALGFSLGWAAWYNWSVTLPAEVTAAAIVVRFWDTNGVVPTSALSAIFLILAVAVNCFPSRVYGEFEFWFSTIKVFTILSIVIGSIVLDLGAGAEGFIGFKNWANPFPKAYLGVPGNLGHFLGFWAVLMQACFSFFGSEVPGIAAGEVIDASRNVPRALQRVWIRITLFYVGGIFCAGLLVPSTDPGLQQGGGTTAYSSPFVIALLRAKVAGLPHVINATILMSAWSAAASDVYISSRFLFFLARCKHAPQFLGSLIRHPANLPASELPTESEEDEEEAEAEEDFPSVIDIRRQEDSGVYSLPPLAPSGQSTGLKKTDSPGVSVHIENVDASDIAGSDSEDPVGESIPNATPEPYFVLPLAAVLVTSTVGLLSFLSGSGAANGAETAFGWLVSVASVASLQSWAGILFTYIRWHQGTTYAERKNKAHVDDDAKAREVMAQIEKIKEHRHWGQPYLCWYAFAVCLLVLFTNGWTVFVHSGWRIAEIQGEERPTYDPAVREANPVSLFLSSYIPIPFFLLLTFGYKLIHQTKMVELEEMTFSRENVPQPEPPHKKTKREILLGWLLII